MSKLEAAHYGALQGSWHHWARVLDLSEDLLPVVADPSAEISMNSSLTSLGKVPSRFNSGGFAVGFPNWTSHAATADDITRWSSDDRLGVCLQTRRVRAIDVDINDPATASAVHDVLASFSLPKRTRADSSKFLVLFEMPGQFSKRVIRTAHGIIEALMTGQQCVIDSTHPSGARYEWLNGVPGSIPVLTPEQFESLWSVLEKHFATEPSTTSEASVKAAKLATAALNDPVAVALHERGLVLATEPDARIHFTCPFSDEHTTDGAESATTYWPANTGGYARGHFLCLHAHCNERHDYEFLTALGLVEDPADDYEAVLIGDAPTGETVVSKAVRFMFVGDDAYSSGPPMQWIVKSVIPRAELGVIYGPPGSGKSFFALDLVMAIARGEEWCGCKVTPGRVGYIVAEGASGFKNRITAYRVHNNITDGELIKVLAAVPNLITRQDVIDLGNAIIHMGGLDLLIYDTLARGTAGADENSAKDMGVAIANCRLLHEMTGAMVILIHHSGKRPESGARGSSAILGAVDVEVEITRHDENRTATVTKMKDGGDGCKFGFRLASVQLGVDDDGDPVSSCIVEYGPVVAKRGRQARLGVNEERIWKAVLDAHRMDGSLPGREDVISAAVAQMPFDNGAGKEDRRREVCHRAFKSLEQTGRLKIVEGAVELVGEAE